MRVKRRRIDQFLIDVSLFEKKLAGKRTPIINPITLHIVVLITRMLSSCGRNAKCWALE